MGFWPCRNNHFRHVPDWAALKIEVRRNGELVQTVDLAQLVRTLPTLLADVSEFMTLQAG